MPTAPLTARPEQRTRSAYTSALLVVVALTAAAVLVWVVSSLLADPDRVDLTLENRTDFPLKVTVQPADGGSTLGLATLGPRSTKTYSGVIDQGEEWLITVSYAGVEAARVSVDRLAIDDGPVVVPASAAAVLREAGLEPPP